MFAKRVLDSIQHTNHMDAGESHYSLVFWSCYPPFLWFQTYAVYTWFATFVNLQ
jgi:hypothetical protein